MTKALKKATMKRFALEIKYLKNESYENMKIYEKQIKICRKLYKKLRKIYYKIDTCEITIIKIFEKQLPLLFLAKLQVYLELL